MALDGSGIDREGGVPEKVGRGEADRGRTRGPIEKRFAWPRTQDAFSSGP